MKTDERLVRHIKDSIKHNDAHYESEIDEWIYKNNNGVYEIIPKKEIIEAFHLAYGYFLDYDDWMKRSNEENDNNENNISYCREPWMHDFEQQIFFQVSRKVCIKCGYVPDFGMSKGYEECHKQYIKYLS